ncbi:hypothetical protein ROHU_010694 [Labeo rohita]|uniref:Uncharacterized protein n=1 Tax=Labeo rohita TaxID=84645 RepID=A0A498LVF3_LABRO|nr:hypothetical protein ROHU_010694 [Labeo rohita]
MLLSRYHVSCSDASQSSSDSFLFTGLRCSLASLPPGSYWALQIISAAEDGPCSELASTGVQPIRHESSSLQYGPGPVIISGSNIDTGLSNLIEQLDVGKSPSCYTSPVPQQQGNSQSECELSSGTASPFPEQLEQAYSPAIVRPKATAVPAIPLLDIRPPTSCLGAPRDVTHPSVRWQTSQTTAHMVYSASTLQSLVPQTAATYERLTTPAFSAVSRPSSYNLVSSLPHTITSVKLPISTTIHQTLVPPAYQLQITEHSRLQRHPMPALDPYQPSTVITDHYAPQSLMQTSVQNWYPLTVAPTMPHMAAPARPAYQLVPPAPLLQPVPVPSLPKLVNDSEREFTDLKIALDSLLNPCTDLTEHYKYRVLMEQLVLDEAKLIAQACTLLSSHDSLTAPIWPTPPACTKRGCSSNELPRYQGWRF